MTDLAKLLALPANNEDRADAWERITSPVLIDALRDAAQDRTLDQASAGMVAWQAIVPFKDDKGRREWEMLQALRVCAQIAACQGAEADIPRLLRRFDPLFKPWKTVSHQGAQPWPDSLRSQLSACRWTPPLSTAWAWDAVLQFMGWPRGATRRERVGVLLVAERGLVALLTLEQLDDRGWGELYPDPSTMSFVLSDEVFQRAWQNAQLHTRTLGLWEADPPIDVRWKLERQDGGRLAHVQGNSAGGAFALALIKLLSERLTEAEV